MKLGHLTNVTYEQPPSCYLLKEGKCGWSGNSRGRAHLRLMSPSRGKHLGCVAGVQLVKLTPYRSHVSIFAILQSVAILSIVGLKGGVLSYAAVSTPTHCAS